VRCQTCDERPVAAEWVDSPAVGAHGSGRAPKRRIPLVLPYREDRLRRR